MGKPLEGKQGRPSPVKIQDVMRHSEEGRTAGRHTAFLLVARHCRLCLKLEPKRASAEGWGGLRGWGWTWEEAMDHLKREEAEEPLQESFPCQAPALSSLSILEVLPADFSPALTFFDSGGD